MSTAAENALLAVFAKFTATKGDAAGQDEDVRQFLYSNLCVLKTAAEIRLSDLECLLRTENGADTKTFNSKGVFGIYVKAKRSIDELEDFILIVRMVVNSFVDGNPSKLESGQYSIIHRIQSIVREDTPYNYIKPIYDAEGILDFSKETVDFPQFGEYRTKLRKLEDLLSPDSVTAPQNESVGKSTPK